MFQLLQPIWLYAMGGIIIPLIIHLWDVRGGKKLLVGNITLIQESARQQGRSLRLTDILLLILRCLLIIALAFVLAQPTWKKQLTSSSEKGWILMEKHSVRQVYEQFTPEVDSLLNAGYSFHYFNTGFPQQIFKDALLDEDSLPDTRRSYWSLLKDLNEQVPAELPLVLFSDDQLQRFQGKRPEISLALTWHTFQSKDTSAVFSMEAYRTQVDSVRLITGISNPTSTFYSSENISNAGNAQFKLLNNKIHALASTHVRNVIDIDTSTIQVAIYSDQSAGDADYVKAAIEAIQQYTQRKMKISIVTSVAEVTEKLDWLFWLSEKPVLFKQRVANIFMYEKGKQQSINSWIVKRGDHPLNQQPVKLTRRISLLSNSPAFETIWQDGFGDPVLSKESSKANTYHYYSRFDPDWTSLPWEPQFAEMLFDLMIPVVKTDDPAFDKRSIDAVQLQPLIAKDKKAFDKDKFVKTTDLGKFFWLLAFLIFCVERYISLRLKNSARYA